MAVAFPSLVVTLAGTEPLSVSKVTTVPSGAGLPSASTRVIARVATLTPSAGSSFGSAVRVSTPPSPPARNSTVTLALLPLAVLAVMVAVPGVVLLTVAPAWPATVVAVPGSTMPRSVSNVTATSSIGRPRRSVTVAVSVAVSVPFATTRVGVAVRAIAAGEASSTSTSTVAWTWPAVAVTVDVPAFGAVSTVVASPPAVSAWAGWTVPRLAVKSTGIPSPTGLPSGAVTRAVMVAPSFPFPRICVGVAESVTTGMGPLPVKMAETRAPSGPPLASCTPATVT